MLSVAWIEGLHFAKFIYIYFAQLGGITFAVVRTGKPKGEQRKAKIKSSVGINCLFENLGTVNINYVSPGNG